jgi:hypothetical protein
MDRQIRRISSKNDAVIKTLQDAVVGQVQTSKRSPKRPWEQKALHGRAISFIMKKRGTPLVTYDDDVVADVQSTLNISVAEAIDDAWRTSRDQAHVLKDIIKLLVMDLADNARDRLFGGKVGTNTQRTRRRKRNLAAKGFATKEGGPTPPFGVETGRFAKGLKGVVKRPRKGRRRGVG